MNHDPGKALVAMQAALFARELYGSGHLAAVRPAADAARMVYEALGELESIEVLIIERRVVCAGVMIDESVLLREGLIPRLHAAGIGSIRFLKGVTAEEVTQVVEQITGETNKGRPGSEHIRFGHLVLAGTGDQVQPNIKPTAETGEAMNAILTSAANGGTVDQKSLEGVIGAVCAAVALERGAILPLAAVRNHDEYTYLHTVNVGVLAAALAEAVGLGPHIVREITMAALLHDVGKKSVPLEILKKEGPLTPMERARIMRHPVDGARLLLEAPGVSNLARTVAYEHHMLMNGKGYPERHRMRPIHLASRIVQLADVYDALRTNRPYRAALTPMQIQETLLKGSGTIYDPDLLKQFLRVVAHRMPIENAAPCALVQAA